MDRDKLVSALVRKLESKPRSLVKEGRDDEIIVESARETLRFIGQNVSVEAASKALQEVKKERYEASIPGKTKRYLERIIPQIKHLGRRALVVGSVVGAISGVGYGVGSFYADYIPNPPEQEPSGFVEGTVIETSGSARWKTYKIKVNTPKGIYDIKIEEGVGSQGFWRRGVESIEYQIGKGGVSVEFPTRNRGIFKGKVGIVDPDDINIKR